MAAGVLYSARRDDVPGADKSVYTLVQLRHDGVGTADAADRARREPREELFIRAVEDYCALISMSCIGMEEFFTPITFGTESIVRSRELFSPVPASCGML